MFNVFLSSSFWSEIAVPIIIGALAFYASYKFSGISEKQTTSRLLFEKSFQQIFELTEKDLFKKDLSVETINDYGYKILEICSTSDGYFDFSVKGYAVKLINTNSPNHIEEWQYFSERFTMRYDKVSNRIGLPVRNSSYRLNNQQYMTRTKMFWLLFKNEWPGMIFCAILILFIYIQSK